MNAVLSLDWTLILNVICVLLPTKKIITNGVDMLGNEIFCLICEFPEKLFILSIKGRSPGFSIFRNHEMKHFWNRNLVSHVWDFSFSFSQTKDICYDIFAILLIQSKSNFKIYLQCRNQYIMFKSVLKCRTWKSFSNSKSFQYCDNNNNCL